MAEPVRAVDRALDVLLCFTLEDPNLTLTQISELIGIHKSTVHRLLATLESKRFVERDEATATYHLGLGLAEMAYLVLRENNVQRQARPHLMRLVEQHRETVDLAVLDGSEVTYVQVIESPERVKLAAAPGGRLPAFCTASGKAFLAHLDQEQVATILQGVRAQRTPYTRTSLSEIYEDLRLTREARVRHFRAGNGAEYQRGFCADPGRPRPPRRSGGACRPGLPADTRAVDGAGSRRAGRSRRDRPRHGPPFRSTPPAGAFR